MAATGATGLAGLGAGSTAVVAARDAVADELPVATEGLLGEAATGELDAGIDGDWADVVGGVGTAAFECGTAAATGRAQLATG